MVADAQTHGFEHFDWVISRFGVMFFADPVAAFTNLRRAGDKLRCIVWRGGDENPFMTTAERAAAPLIEIPPRDPHAGQFAFADPGRVRRILEQAGWDGVALDPLEVECTMPKAVLETYVSRLGLVAIALQDADEATKAARRVRRPSSRRFEPFIDGDTVRASTRPARIVRGGT